MAMICVLLARYSLIVNKKKLVGVFFLIADVLFLIYSFIIVSYGLGILSFIMSFLDLQLILNEVKKNE